MAKKMSGRLIMAIINSVLEQTALVVIVLWGLPKMGVEMPLWGSIVLLVVLMKVWGIWSIILYRKGSQALKMKPVVGLSSMVGSRGEVVRSLTPEGLVKIRGELWVAEAESGEVNPGSEIVVVGQDRLKLVVRQSD